MASLGETGIQPLSPEPLGAAIADSCIRMATAGASNICHGLCFLKMEQQDPKAGQGWEAELGNETALSGTGQRACWYIQAYLTLLGEWQCSVLRADKYCRDFRFVRFSASLRCAENPTTLATKKCYTKGQISGGGLFSD